MSEEQNFKNLKIGDVVVINSGILDGEMDTPENRINEIVAIFDIEEEPYLGAPISYPENEAYENLINISYDEIHHIATPSEISKYCNKNYSITDKEN